MTHGRLTAAKDLPRRISNRLLISLPLPTRRRLVYARAHRRPLSLRRPIRFSEKVNWRIVYDRRDLIGATCDKQGMKDYALATTAPGQVRIPQTLWLGDDIAELADIPLPAAWVLKPNNGTGHVYFGSGRPNLAEISRFAFAWLGDQELVRWGEWAYDRARPLLLVEERIGLPTDAGLNDYKFFVFNGRPLLIQMDIGRFTQHRRRYYTPDWRALPNVSGFPLAPVVPPPSSLGDMLSAAATIGGDFDFIRVDLYEEGGQTWFGEITPYPGSGLEPFAPNDLDFTLGKAWQLPTP